MLAVRYLALAMLVLWLGTMADRLAGWGVPLSASGHVIGGPYMVAYIAGTTILACFVVMKLVGPPPRAFTARTTIVVLMLAAATYSDLTHHDSTILMAADAALGLALLFWYARE